VLHGLFAMAEPLVLTENALSFDGDSRFLAFANDSAAVFERCRWSSAETCMSADVCGSDALASYHRLTHTLAARTVHGALTCPACTGQVVSSDRSVNEHPAVSHTPSHNFSHRFVQNANGPSN